VLNRKFLLAIVPFLLSVPFAGRVFGADWPTYQHDIRRSGITSERLEPPLPEQWVFQSPHAPVPAWADPSPKPIEGKLELPRMRFDDAFHVAAVGDSVYFGSSVDHRVYALDALSGEPRWAVYTGAAVRLAPTVWQDKLYVGSDDGFVYCLDTADGRVIWKYRAAPYPEKVLGRGKLISLWPVRTGVLVDAGVAYFGAGIFPAEGLYLYAVDAETGELLWKNDSFAQGGQGHVSPQGYLLASANKLFVPSGRCAPAVFDRGNGEFLYQSTLSWRTHGLFGGTYAFLAGDLLYNGTEQIVAYQQKTGKLAYAYQGHRLVMAESSAYLMAGEEIIALDHKRYPEIGKRFRAMAEKSRRLQVLRRSLAAIDQELNTIDMQETQSKLAELDKKLEAVGQTSRSPGKEHAELTKQRDALNNQLAEQRRRKNTLTERKADAQAELRSAGEDNKEAKQLLQDATQWKCPFDGSDAMILAGDILFAGGENQVVAVDAVTGRRLWSAQVRGKARALAAASGRLLVGTDQGAIHCFGHAPAPFAHRVISPPVDLTPYPTDSMTRFYEQTAEAIVKDSSVQRGYGLILGGGDGRLAMELAGRSELLIHVVEPDADKVAAARKALTAAGLYGTRVCVDQRPLSGLGYPKYFANLIVCEDSLLAGRTSIPPRELLSLLKPHGGVAYVGRPHWAEGPGRPALSTAPRKSGAELITPWKAPGRPARGLGAAEAISAPDLGGAVRRSNLQHWLDGMCDGSTKIQWKPDTWAKISRAALPGAGKWTHQYAEPGNTTCSDDQIVKGPLGILWFGEPGPAEVPNRHAGSVAPLSVDGRMFVAGRDAFLAYDAYNGLRLWERKSPGAARLELKKKSESGNMAASGDSLFVAVGSQCLRLDAETGKTRKTYPVPTRQDTDTPAPRWGYLACVGDTLFGSRVNGDAISDCVFALDIDSGRRKWLYPGKQIRHSSIAIGDDRLYLVDSVVTAEQEEQALREKPSGAVDRKGLPDVRLVVALQIATGEPCWEKPLDVSDCVKISKTGGELAAMYSHDTLLLCGEPWNGHFWTQFFEGQFSRRSLIALAGDTGRLLWSDHIGYRSRPLIVGDTIYAEPWAHDLRTGAAKTRVHPITGQQTKWQMARPGHHCGCIAASPNCLFFRSWSTAYYDLLADYGTCHYGSQRPGCWINFIPANGLVLIPEASSGCVCPFALHCTVVLHPRKVNRVWGMFSAAGPATPVKHMAVNLGAPGDRKDARGTLWLGYPRPWHGRLVFDFDLNAEIQPGGDYYQHDAEDRPAGGSDTASDPSWVFSSGCRGLTRLTLPLLDEGSEPTEYTVRLSFAEPDNAKPGQRIFNVVIQGREVLTSFDVAGEANGSKKALVKQFEGIRVEDNLDIELSPAPSAAVAAPVLCGIEVTAKQ